MFENFISQLPLYLISLPVILLSLSLHETAHGYLAYKCGDDTARSLGRLTLNPLKHIDLIGFFCMLFFHFGWAKPVPVNARNFKKPKRDMALVGAAGPISNLLLALIFALLLRISLAIIDFCGQDMLNSLLSSFYGSSVPILYTTISLLIFMLYLGVTLNIHLAVFNLLPIPPLDGSRIFHIFLPTKIYFKIMQYERYIALALFVLLYLGVLSKPISFVSSWIESALLNVMQIPGKTYNIILMHVVNTLTLS